MNKQQALEALLTKMRQWEQPQEETRAVHEGEVMAELKAEASRMQSVDRTALIAIGAAALYLLTDEVTVVAGRSLDEWLAEPGNREGMAMVKKLGGALVAAGYTGPANPQPINGSIAPYPRPEDGC